MALSAAAIKALTGRENGDPIICLLTVDHDDLVAPLRLAMNTAGDDIVSNGNTFTAAPFDIEWPSDTEETAVAKLRALNVDREIGIALDALTSPCSCTLQIVLASTPDTVEREGILFELRNAQWDGAFLTAELSQAQLTNEPWPRWRVTPALFPSLFR